MDQSIFIFEPKRYCNPELKELCGSEADEYRLALVTGYIYFSISGLPEGQTGFHQVQTYYTLG